MKRLWWEQTGVYWELPFFMDIKLYDYNVAIPERDDQLAAREQLWAILHVDEEPGEEVPGLDLWSNNVAAKENIG